MGHTVSTDFAAQRLLDIARRDGLEAAVKWLRKIVGVTSATGGAVKALYGVTCSGPVAISDKIVLIPFMELPPSETRDWILAEHQRANELRGVHGVAMPPAAALYRRETLDPLYTPFPLDEDRHGEQAQWFSDLDDAALLLVLVPAAVPSEAAHWMHFDDPDIARVGQFGIGRNSMIEFVQLSFKMPVTVNAESVAGLLSAYQALRKDDKNRVRLALERLLRSRCQLHPGNRAIDIAIALEVLFMRADPR